MKRMLERKDVTSSDGRELADVRVRVDMTLLAQVLGPQAIGKRGHLVKLFGGSLSVEAFNIRPAPLPADSAAWIQPSPLPPDAIGKGDAGTE